MITIKRTPIIKHGTKVWWWSEDIDDKPIKYFYTWRIWDNAEKHITNDIKFVNKKDRKYRYELVVKFNFGITI